MSSVGELEEQIAGYEEQLVAIDAAVAEDADNDDLKTLQRELRETLQLTRELLATQRMAGTTVTQTDASATSNVVAVTPVAAVDIDTLPAHLRPDASCRAVWADDGALYDAKVVRIALSGDVVVRFVGYKGETTVSRDAVQPPDAAASSAVDNGKKKKKKKDKNGTDGGDDKLVIPISLQVQPTDSEEVRQRKRKRVRALKSAHRLKKIEKEKQKSASSWQNFVTKKASKKSNDRFQQLWQKAKEHVCIAGIH
eukprot:TRINITY_DN6007_c0_g1_i1.p1 TRINITY_DN6007_c0_g1~~TRINITY_DN6007_c0_g1_i1.p1  ORF type:complete len:253 (+),score=86.08 TRINITY_DN6007_c0_g1_i1:44-802(+)